jgi:hypothetical protein
MLGRRPRLAMERRRTVASYSHVTRRLDGNCNWAEVRHNPDSLMIVISLCTDVVLKSSACQQAASSSQL